MSDYGKNNGSFDVDKELDELLKNLHTAAENPQPAGKKTPASGAPQRRPAGSQAQPKSQSQTQAQARARERRLSKTARTLVPSPLRNTQPKPKITSTTRDGMQIYEDKTDYSRIDDSKASYYNGEVYFAAKKPTHPNSQDRGGAAAAKKTSRKPKNKFEAVIYNISKSIRNGGPRGIAMYLGILLVISIILSSIAMSFVNDILAFNRGDEVKTITVGENASTGDIISLLDKEGLIKHGWFCKVFMVLTSSLHDANGKPVYLSGVYYLTPNMGVEKMLLQCQETQKADTVTVTIPEGFTIEQIAKKLEKSKVCMSNEFYKNIEQANFSYKFLNAIENKNSRYEYLEGYLYPDTYEFYVGQNASSVINKLLENFGVKWTDDYQKRANELGMSVDEVITLASIIQREAANSEQMPVIAGIFYNRLKSNGFPSLQSNATNDYVNKFIKPNVTIGEFDTFWAKYSTYACTGLPVGPICCPGDDAIKAALWPANTDAYYFCHDKAGTIYTARTEAEHNANYYKALIGED